MANLDVFDKFILYFKEKSKRILKKLYQKIIILSYVGHELYERGFLSIYEQELCKNFHNTPLQVKNNIIDRFTDSTLQELAIRILRRNYISYLTEPYYTRFKNYLNKIFSSSDDAPVDYKGNKRYMAKMALEEISTLLDDVDLDLSKRSLLVDLKDYILKFYSGI